MELHWLLCTAIITNPILCHGFCVIGSPVELGIIDVHVGGGSFFLCGLLFIDVYVGGDHSFSVGYFCSLVCKEHSNL